MLTDPSGAQEDTEDLLLSDWLVGGFRVGLGCRSEDGVDVDVDERDELRVDRGRRLAKLTKDPVLEVTITRSEPPQADITCISDDHAVSIHLDGHFVLCERSAPKQLVDAVNGQEARDVGT